MTPTTSDGWAVRSKFFLREVSFQITCVPPQGKRVSRSFSSVTSCPYDWYHACLSSTGCPEARQLCAGLFSNISSHTPDTKLDMDSVTAVALPFPFPKVSCQHLKDTIRICNRRLCKCPETLHELLASQTWPVFVVFLHLFDNCRGFIGGTKDIFRMPRKCKRRSEASLAQLDVSANFQSCRKVSGCTGPAQ